MSQVRGGLLSEMATDMQYAVGRRCGIGLMRTSITATAEQSPDLPVVSIDFKSALKREKIV